TLRARLANAAEVYEPLRLRLLSEAQATTGRVDVPALKKELTSMLRVSSRHEHWRGARDYADEAQAAIEVVAGVLHAGAAVEAMALAEHVMRRLETALRRVDDSGGFLSWPVEQVAELHHAACVAARPDPRKLAVRLFELGEKSEWEWLIHAPEVYADVLGEDGLSAF